MFTTMNLALVWIVLGGICLIPLITRHKSVLLMVPIIVLGSIYGTFQINDEFMGRPKEMQPLKEFIFKGYTISLKDKERIITLWIHDGIDDRLIRFPYSNQKNEALKKAKKQTENGIPQKGMFLKKKIKKEESIEFLVFRDINLSEAIPKG